ncbi:MAG: helix-turn-helix transcriptional regulator [Rhodomicrobium sp.]|nr:helix-turn-helix transcriptional regulator [Rhodomicrobium sp.]
MPILVIDISGRIVEMNAAARKLLQEKRLIAATGRYLNLCDLRAQARFAAALRQAAQPEDRLSSKGIGIPLRRDTNEGIAHILPLSGSDRRKTFAPGGAAAVFIQTQGETEQPDLSGVAELFGLTGAERRMLELLVEGLTLAEIMDELDIAQGTAKTHLARIFAKTGTRRQAELINKIGRLLSPVRI